MKVSDLRFAVTRLIQANIVPFVQASPGVGKSAVINQIAAEYNLKVIDLRLASSDPTDLSGLPHFFKDANGRNKAQYATFDTFPLEGDPLPKDANGKDMAGWLLFLDEFSSAPKSVQAPAYKLVLDRMVGQNKLHDKVAIVAAGNKSTDNAIVIKLSTALQSRVAHLFLDVDKKEWVDWAIKNDIDSRIIGLVEFAPGNLHNFDPNHTDNTFSCPRTLEMLSRVVKGKQVTVDDYDLIEGVIGKGAATEFITFCDIYQNLPPIADIIKDPAKCPLPAEKSQRYALATYVADNMDKNNAGALVDYLMRMDVDFRVVAIRMANTRIPGINMVPAVNTMLRDLVNYMK